MASAETKPAAVDKRNWIQLYIIEVLEAFVMIVIIRLALKKHLLDKSIIVDSMGIGLLTLFLEQYSSAYKTSLQGGIGYILGTTLLANHV